MRYSDPIKYKVDKNHNVEILYFVKKGTRQITYETVVGVGDGIEAEHFRQLVQTYEKQEKDNEGFVTVEQDSDVYRLLLEILDLE